MAKLSDIGNVVVHPLEIFNYLMTKTKMTETKALGILANIKAESQFYVDAVEIGDMENKGIGLFQHTFPARKQAFLKAVPDWKTNWKAQIDFALTEAEAQKYLNTTFDSVADSTKAFMLDFEKPADQSEAAIQKRIDGLLNIGELDLPGNMNGEPDFQVKSLEEYENYYGPGTRIININAKDYISVPDGEGGFDQIPIERANLEVNVAAKVEKQEELAKQAKTIVKEEKDARVTKEMLEDAESELEEINEEEPSIDFESGRILTMGNRNYYVFEKDGEFFALPETSYKKEIRKHGGGDVRNHEYIKKLPYNEEKLVELIENGTIIYDENYDVNALPPVQEFDPNKIDLTLKDDGYPDDFDRNKLVDPKPLNLDPEADGNLQNFINEQQNKEGDKDGDGIKDSEDADIAQNTDPNDLDGDGTPNFVDPDYTTPAATDKDPYENVSTTNYMDTLGDLGKVLEQGLGIVEEVRNLVNNKEDLELAALGKRAYMESLKTIKPSKIPELSNMYKEHMNQLGQLSKMGFSVEEAQKARAEIDGAYGKGIENAVRGTAGDRAKFLAMSGVLDSRRQSALLDFAAKDAELNRRNLDSYSKALSFAEEYNLNKSKAERADELKLEISRQQGASNFAQKVFQTLQQKQADAQLNPIIRKYKNMITNNMTNNSIVPLQTPGVFGIQNPNLYNISGTQLYNTNTQNNQYTGS